MKAMNRVNRMGIQYHITEMPGTSTVAIRTRDKQIIVSHSFKQIEEGWYDWLMLGRMIQDAFHFMNADEREFLMTGFTPDEWKAMFGNGETE